LLYQLSYPSPTDSEKSIEDGAGLEPATYGSQSEVTLYWSALPFFQVKKEQKRAVVGLEYRLHPTSQVCSYAYCYIAQCRTCPLTGIFQHQKAYSVHPSASSCLRSADRLGTSAVARKHRVPWGWPYVLGVSFHAELPEFTKIEKGHQKARKDLFPACYHYTKSTKGRPSESNRRLRFDMK